MGTATVDNQTVEFEDGPYLYDDPRFIYDEPCMFYNGGFDLQCLLDLQIIIPKKIGKRTAKRTAKTSPAIIYKKQDRLERDERVVLDVEIAVDVVSVNDNKIKYKADEKKYHLEYNPIKVKVSELQHRIDDFRVFAQAISSSIKTPKIHPTNKIKLLPFKTFVSSSSFEHRARGERFYLKSEIISVKSSKKKEDKE